MSNKTAKKNRDDAAAETVVSNPQALLNAQITVVRLDAAIEGMEAAVKSVDAALSSVREAIGSTRADRRKVFADVERMQKAVGLDGKTKPPDAEKPAEPDAAA